MVDVEMDGQDWDDDMGGWNGPAGNQSEFGTTANGEHIRHTKGRWDHPTAGKELMLPDVIRRKMVPNSRSWYHVPT